MVLGTVKKILNKSKNNTSIVLGNTNYYKGCDPEKFILISKFVEKESCGAGVP